MPTGLAQAVWSLTPILLLAACGGPAGGDAVTVHLVDAFDPERVQGTPAKEGDAPLAKWDFSTAQAGDTLGWKAGPGVTGLRVADGKLVGRSTTDFPILYASRPNGVDANDGLHSLQLTARVSSGANLSAFGAPEANPSFERIMGVARVFPWPLTSPLQTDNEPHALNILPAISSRLTQFTTVMLRPTDVAGAEFAIESIQLVSQAEHRASIPSGVGWQGLADIYRETIVSRSPEVVSIDTVIPGNAWLDLNLGTVAEGAVTFRVSVKDGDKQETLLEQTVTTPHRWEAAPVELARFAGPRTLTFSLDVDQERTVGFWGSPTIRTHGAMPKTARPPAEALGAAPPQGVILLMCDTLRKDHLSAYGYDRPTSPNLERVASQGALFLDNVSQATWTKVSTPSIMTSLYPTSHRVADIPDRLSFHADTLAESYRAAGFATVSYSSVLFTGKFTNLHQGFEELHEASSFVDSSHAAKTAREYIDRASGWITRHRDAPFFMYLHVFDPHDPFEPRSPYDAVWADPSQKKHHEEQLEKIRPHIENPLMRAFGMPAKAEIEKAGVAPDEFIEHDKGWYDGSILGMDAEVGRLLRHLRRLGLEDKVQLVFLSDHGEEFVEHGRMFHGQSVYGELSGVPLIFYRPGVMPAGARIAATVRNIDVMPTLLDMSGLAPPEAMQGESLTPLLAAAKQSSSPEQLLASAEKLGWNDVPAVTEKAKTQGAAAPPPLNTEAFGIVLDGWKLIHHTARPDGAPELELFDHTKDPLDLQDVAAQHPDIVDRLKTELAAWKAMAEERKLPKGEVAEEMSSKELDRLRSLGYIQ